MILVGDFIPKNLSVELPEEFGDHLVVANLEGALCSDGMRKSHKVGPCLHTTFPIQDAKGQNLSLDKFAFVLANNHMMDFGDEGLRQTLRNLGNIGVPHAGADKDVYEARKPMLLQDEGCRVAVISCCERQFGMAEKDRAGCADKGVWLYDAIQRSKKQADRVIISCHAANEFSPWVNPRLRDFYHSLIDAGADMVHGHHSHVPQGFEEYKGKPIFYGLGNFVVDPLQWDSNPNQLWSMVVKVDLSDPIKWSINHYGLERHGLKVKVEALRGRRAQECDRYLRACNYQFESDNEVACWQEVACRLYYRIYDQLLRAPAVKGRRLGLKDIIRKAYMAVVDGASACVGREIPTQRSVRYGKVLYNYFNCESHVATIATALGVLTGSETDRRTEKTKELSEILGIV